MSRPHTIVPVLFYFILPILIALSVSTVRAETAEHCRQKLIQAQQLEILTDLDWKPPQAPKVVVG